MSLKCPECGSDWSSCGSNITPGISSVGFTLYKCGARILGDDFVVPCPNKGLEMNPAVLREQLKQKDKDIEQLRKWLKWTYEELNERILFWGGRIDKKEEICKLLEIETTEKEAGK